MNKLNDMMNESPNETLIEKHIREQINTMGHETEEVVTQVAIRIAKDYIKDAHRILNDLDNNDREAQI